ncbi:MAG: PQQ-dependent sugar dehydrogenase [Pirellulaceae bacterium]|nr:PQQ-dependent sugar dehydrogenase [Pirellulaceae bacterium]
MNIQTYRLRAALHAGWRLLGNCLSLTIAFGPCVAADLIDSADSSLVQPADETLDWSRFERKTIASQLQQPMEFDIAADGTIFLIELAGKLKTIDPQTGVQSVVGELSVTTEQENGLIGLALAPDFENDHWIYLQYSPPDFSGQRVSRFQFRDGRLLLDSEQQLLEYPEQRRECCHHAGSLEFGPDGCLYIGTGDNTNPFDFSEGYAPIDPRADREPWDAQRTSANSQNWNGKVLRIRPEPGGGYSIPEGNLFPADGSQGLPEIYVMGCRNPWRISVDQRTGYVYWGDVGPDAGQDGPRGPRGYDEINQARQAGNFGWPYFIGDNFAYSSYDFETKMAGQPMDPLAPENHSPNNTGTRQLPPAQPALIYYPGSAFEKFPELGAGGRTACAGPVFYAQDYQPHPYRLPDYFEGCLFIHEWSRNWLMAVHLKADGRVDRIEPFLQAEKFTRPIQLKFDRGGVLHVLLYGETWGINHDAELVRLDYVRGNRAPRPVIDIDRTFGREPLRIQLSAAKSTDPDGDLLEYLWSYSVVRHATGDRNSTASPTLSNGLPAVDEVVGANERQELIIADPGVYTIYLEAWDDSAASGHALATVIVGNQPPEIKFLRPTEFDFVMPGQAIAYELEITDFEDGTSNYAAVDQDPQLSELNPSAVSRMNVQLTSVGADGQPIGDSDLPPGLRLIRQSDCLNCHAANRPLVGPSFVEIARKYRDQAGAQEQSVQRVLKGSTGVWGKVPMLPHQHYSLADAQTMVEYVYSVSEESSPPTAIGLRNELTVPSDAQAIRLEASYTDGGRGDVPAMTSTTSIVLRSRKIQAEHAAKHRRTKALDSKQAEGGRFMGAIEHRGYLMFPDVRLDQIGGIRASVASAGAGGVIEFRAESRTGTLLGTLEVTVNGHWEEFYQIECPIEPQQLRCDVFAVFKNQQSQQGLMNVDWIEFLPPSAVTAANAQVSPATETPVAETTSLP